MAIKRNPTAELAEIKSQAGKFKYPITDANAMIKMLGTGVTFHFRGRPVDAEKRIRLLEASFFPVKSEEDFLSKVSARLAKFP